MKKLLSPSKSLRAVVAVLCLAPIVAMAQAGSAGGKGTTAPGPVQAPATPPTVSIHANQTDVRTVLHDLFTQTKLNFVVEPTVHYVLWLSLDNVDFDEALAIICHEAKLEAAKKDGIWYISVAPTPQTSKSSTTQSTTSVPTAPALPAVTEADLVKKRVTTRLSKTDIRKVFQDLATQTGIDITVAADIPHYKLDAFLVRTSLKYALHQITSAAHLKYKLVGHSVCIYQDAAENKVALSQ